MYYLWETGTIKRTIQWIYNLDNLPTENEVKNYFKKWEGKETIVTVYLWEAIKLNLTKEDFNKLM